MSQKPLAGNVVTEPVHQQLGRICREALDAGTFKPGEKFPSERQLAEQYQVSRATANKVISNLAAEGRLLRKPGIGMFVAESRELRLPLREMVSFTSQAEAAGLKPETQVMAFESLAYGELPESVQLGLSLQDVSDELRVTRVERLRLVEGKPVIFEKRWIREDLCPGLSREDLAGSFYQLLSERYGIELGGESFSIGARTLSGEAAETLKAPDGLAVLEVEGSGYDTASTPIWYQQLWYHGERYRMRNELRLGSDHHTSIVSMAGSLQAGGK